MTSKGKPTTATANRGTAISKKGLLCEATCKKLAKLLIYIGRQEIKLELQR